MNRENNMSPDTKLHITTNRIHKHINRPITGIGMNKSNTIKKQLLNLVKKYMCLSYNIYFRKEK